MGNTEIDLIVNFFKKTGLQDLFQYPAFTSVTDYLLGVEVGMDTNARKNRSGKAMENMLAPIITMIKAEYSLSFDILYQKQFKQLKEYGIRVNSDIATRKADFILVDKQSRRTVNIETNFYADTGSKPQEFVDSYINRQQELKQNDIEFVWVSDGAAWRGQKIKLCAILIGDTRKAQHYVPLSHFVLQKFLQSGFVLKEEIIKGQHNCTFSKRWLTRAREYKFYLIMHEHLFVFRKPKQRENLSRVRWSMIPEGANSIISSNRLNQAWLAKPLNPLKPVQSKMVSQEPNRQWTYN